MPLHNGHLGDTGKWPLQRGVAVLGRLGCNMTPVVLRDGEDTSILKTILIVAYKYETETKT